MNKPDDKKDKSAGGAAPAPGKLPQLHEHDAIDKKNATTHPDGKHKPPGFVKRWIDAVVHPNSNAIIAIFTVILTITTAVYTVFSILQWIVMKDTFTYANKPSVGVNSIGIEHSGKDASGKPFSSKFKTDGTTNLVMVVELKNFGSVTAEDCLDEMTPTVDGKPMEEIVGVLNKHSVSLFPGKSVYDIGSVGTRDYEAVMNGTKMLAVNVVSHYKGPGKRYTYCENFQFQPRANSFINLGSCPVTQP